MFFRNILQIVRVIWSSFLVSVRFAPSDIALNSGIWPNRLWTIFIWTRITDDKYCVCDSFPIFVPSKLGNSGYRIFEISFFIFVANSESELIVDPIFPMYKPQNTVKIFTRVVWPGSSVSVNDNSPFETFLLIRLFWNESFE